MTVLAADGFSVDAEPAYDEVLKHMRVNSIKSYAPSIEWLRKSCDHALPASADIGKLAGSLR